MLDVGFMAQARASTVQQEREDVDAALQYAASFHLLGEWKDCEELKPTPKEKWIFKDKQREGAKASDAWCVTTLKYRCTRCGKSSKKHEDAMNRCGTEVVGG